MSIKPNKGANISRKSSLPNNIPTLWQRPLAEQLSPVVHKFGAKDVVEFPRQKELLVEILSCCIKCSKIPSPKFLICPIGHITCFECADFELKCTELEFDNLKEQPGGTPCGKSLSPAPCYLFRLLYESLIVQCPAEPCHKQYPIRDRLAHQQTCTGLENIPCVLTDCCIFKTLFTRDSVLEHLTKQHGIPVLEIGERHAFPLPRRYFRGDGVTSAPFIIQLPNQAKFVCVTCKATMEGEGALVVILYSTSDMFPTKYVEGSDWQAKISLRGSQGFCQKWSGVLPTIRQKLRSVIEDRQCLIIPESSCPGVVERLDIEIPLPPMEDPTRYVGKNWEPYVPLEAEGTVNAKPSSGMLTLSSNKDISQPSVDDNREILKWPLDDDDEQDVSDSTSDDGKESSESSWDDTQESSESQG